MTPIEGIRQLKKRDLITNELYTEAFDAYAQFNEERVQEIYDQHATLLNDVSRETVNEKARKLKSIQLYKKVCKTLKHEMFKHSKQHKSDHTCSKCDTKFRALLIVTGKHH